MVIVRVARLGCDCLSVAQGRPMVTPPLCEAFLHKQRGRSKREMQATRFGSTPIPMIEQDISRRIAYLPTCSVNAGI